MEGNKFYWLALLLTFLAFAAVDANMNDLSSVESLKEVLNIGDSEYLEQLEETYQADDEAHTEKLDEKRITKVEKRVRRQEEKELKRKRKAEAKATRKDAKEMKKEQKAAARQEKKQERKERKEEKKTARKAKKAERKSKRAAKREQRQGETEKMRIGRLVHQMKCIISLVKGFSKGFPVFAGLAKAFKEKTLKECAMRTIDGMPQILNFIKGDILPSIKRVKSHYNKVMSEDTILKQLKAFWKYRELLWQELLQYRGYILVTGRLFNVIHGIVRACQQTKLDYKLTVLKSQYIATGEAIMQIKPAFELLWVKTKKYVWWAVKHPIKAYLQREKIEIWKNRFKLIMENLKDTFDRALKTAIFLQSQFNPIAISVGQASKKLRKYERPAGLSIGERVQNVVSGEFKERLSQLKRQRKAVKALFEVLGANSATLINTIVPPDSNVNQPWIPNLMKILHETTEKPK